MTRPQLTRRLLWLAAVGLLGLAAAEMTGLLEGPALGQTTDEPPPADVNRVVEPTPNAPAPNAPAPNQVVDPAPTGPSELPRTCGTPLPTTQQRGMCYAHNWQAGGSRGYGSSISESSLEELAALGVDWISVTPFGYQSSLSDPVVRRVDWPASETDERLRATIEHAHELGLSVMMKPHLWISYDEWRGHIDPGSPEGWDRWFETYRELILHYARLSESTGADMLVVGVELGSSTRRFPDRWRQLIQDVRQVYSGPLTYAANWDEATEVTFWDELDYIGVQMFAPLASSPTDGFAHMRQMAAGYVDRYRAISEEYSRPVILTEVGFKSIPGTAVSPWDWPEHLPSGFSEADEQAQYDAYCAILETFGQADFIAGMYWWKWFTDPETDEEGPIGFSPRGKLAEDLLRAAFQRE